MNQWATTLTTAMQADAAHFIDVSSDLQANALQARLVTDRDKAAALGVSNDVLRSTIYSGFGGQQVSTIYGAGDSYDVIMELDPSTDWTPERLMEMEVATKSGALVPLWRLLPR